MVGAINTLRETAARMVGRISHSLEIALLVVNSHTNIASKWLTSVHERVHLHGQRLQGIESFSRYAFQQKRTALVEHQLWRRLQQSTVNIGIGTIIGVRKNGGNGTVECQRLTVKLIARLRQIEVGERIVGIALPLPTKIHVKESALIESVSHPSVARSIAFRKSLQIYGATIEQFLPQNLGKTARSLRGLNHIGSRIVEMLLQSMIRHYALRAARTGSVLHKRRNTHIAHQLCHRCFLCLVSTHRITVIRQHVCPIVVRLAEIGTQFRIIIIHDILVCATPLHWPLIVIHHLRHRRSHTAAIRIARFCVERVRLPPFAFQ